MRPARSLVLAVVTSSLVAAACTGDDDTGPPPPITAPPTATNPTTTTIAPPSPDDPLTLGLLLPEPGEDPLATALTAGAETAVQDARAAGAEIRVVSEVEGETRAETADAVNRLVEEEVDAVVGPSSSTTALNTLDLLVDAGIPTCSPTASSLLLDEFPDDDLFMRTIPSDSLQALAIAELASDTGAGDVAIAYIDDHYGRGLSEATVDAINTLGTQNVLTHVPIPDDAEAMRDAVDRLVADQPGAVIVLADAEHGTQFLVALDEHISEEPSWTSRRGDVIVNAALRRPQPPDALSQLDNVRSSIRGVSPMAKPPSTTTDLDGPYSLNSYNCITAFSFAWHVAGMQDRHLSIPLVAEITSSGFSCTSYERCVNWLEDNPTDNVNYSGPDRQLELAPSGDPAEAQFDIFAFDEDGTDIPAPNNPMITVTR